MLKKVRQNLKKPKTAEMSDRKQKEVQRKSTKGRQVKK